MILLTGATGRVGTAAARALVRAEVPFKILVRDPDKVAFDCATVDVVQGDLSDTASVEGALSGVTRALIVMGNHPDQARLERQFASSAVAPSGEDFLYGSVARSDRGAAKKSLRDRAAYSRFRCGLDFPAPQLLHAEHVDVCGVD